MYCLHRTVANVLIHRATYIPIHLIFHYVKKTFCGYRLKGHEGSSCTDHKIKWFLSRKQWQHLQLNLSNMPCSSTSVNILTYWASFTDIFFAIQTQSLLKVTGQRLLSGCYPISNFTTVTFSSIFLLLFKYTMSINMLLWEKEMMTVSTPPPLPLLKNPTF